MTPFRPWMPFLFTALALACGHRHETAQIKLGQAEPGTPGSDGAKSVTVNFKNISFQLPDTDRAPAMSVFRDGVDSEEIYVFGQAPAENDAEVFVTKLSCDGVRNDRDLKNFVTSFADQDRPSSAAIVNGKDGIRKVLGTRGDVRGYYYEISRSSHKSYEREMVLKNLRRNDDDCISIKINSLGSEDRPDPSALTGTVVDSIVTTLRYTSDSSQHTAANSKENH